MKYMFMALATSLVVLFLLLCYCRYFDNFYSNAYCFSLLWLYLGNSQVSVYRTIGPTLVFFLFVCSFIRIIYHKILRHSSHFLKWCITQQLLILSFQAHL